MKFKGWVGDWCRGRFRSSTQLGLLRAVGFWVGRFLLAHFRSCDCRSGDGVFFTQFQSSRYEDIAQLRISGGRKEVQFRIASRDMDAASLSYLSCGLRSGVGVQTSPDGQVKFPHPWPPQIPPGRTAGL